MRRFVIPLLLLLSAGPALAGTTAMSPAQIAAAQRADRLDALFARLHRARTADAAQVPERDIWALWMTSGSPTADALLAQATRAMNDRAYAPARQILDKMVMLYPDYAEVWNKRATLNYIEDRLDDSLADIDRVLALEPRHFGALAGKGMVLVQEKKYAAAVAAFQDALAINPNMPAVQDELKAVEKLARDI